MTQRDVIAHMKRYGIVHTVHMLTDALYELQSEATEDGEQTLYEQVRYRLEKVAEWLEART